MNIEQSLINYLAQQLNKMKESGYFECIKLRNKCHGAWDFVKTIISVQSVYQLRPTVHQYFETMQGLILEKDLS